MFDTDGTFSLDGKKWYKLLPTESQPRNKTTDKDTEPLFSNTLLTSMTVCHSLNNLILHHRYFMIESNEMNQENESITPVKVLIVYYSRYGNTSRMAEEIAYGAKEISNIKVTIRRIADDVPMEVISKNLEWTKIVEDLDNRYPTTSIKEIINELPNHDAIIFGSPTRFGNMAWPLKELWDGTSDLWFKGSLIGKIGAVFTSAASVHGGQETTAISMMFPMFHHGMILVGVPYSVPELAESGSPYGPSRIVGTLSNKAIKEADIRVARALGKRISEITKKFVISK